MKGAVAAVIALLVGLVLGGLGPRADLRDAKLEVTRLQEELEDCDKGPNPLVSGMANMLGRPSRERTRRPAPIPRERVDHSTDGGIRINLGPDEDLSPEEEELAEALQGMSDPEEMIDTAAELWGIRASQARQSLIEGLDLSPDEIDRFDETMLNMNEDLMTEVEDLARRLEEDPDIGPRDGLELVHDFSGILMDAYSETDDIFPEPDPDAPEIDYEVIDFIDPSVARPMLDLLP